MSDSAVGLMVAAKRQNDGRSAIAAPEGGTKLPDVTSSAALNVVSGTLVPVSEAQLAATG
jgi:hypothetical protein